MVIIKKSAKIIKDTISVLNAGGVVICPTDTVYGFLADARSKSAVQKIYKIKKRPKSKPLPVFVKDLKMAKELAVISDKQVKILKKFWPGKYTFVLKRKPGVKLYGVEKDTIAIRIPKDNFLNNLLNKINKPLVQTSVNISSEPTIIKFQNIIDQFGKSKNISLIIDGGNLRKAKPSKIYDLTSKQFSKLR